ncbi:TnsA endonuclease N-terminal domain-containing protein [Aliidiomarina sanyensis]|uniref:Heteromeric transposase endonuclease subunit TnsA n=1 Tax=Aliidiomarina sanyensis TaxID=1249555 RepID=A0A432WPJ6_9GAMM|nr:TnsA endonuclease N-terminal domain-containing protein [Aliidiomarina sanyensis]RUO35695.1 heteromeric transposase endonuclease subunit TnsA [Aliidiomarina sanyensis]
MPKYVQQRKIKPTRLSLSGFYSFRGQDSIPYESTLERDFLTIMEANSSVSNIIPQPVELSYQHSNGNRYRYTPDFLVQFDSTESIRSFSEVKPLLVEVKPRAELRRNFKKWKPKFKAAMHFAKSEGMIFHIFDERLIRTQVLDNMKFLSRYRLKPYMKAHRPKELKLITEQVELFEFATVRDVVESLYTSFDRRALALTQVWHLLAIGILECDLNDPLNLDTTVWVNANEDVYGE